MAEREEAAQLRLMATRDAAKEYAVKLEENEQKLKQVLQHFTALLIVECWCWYGCWY